MPLPTHTAATARWSELPADAPMPRLSRRRLIGAHAMISHIRLQKGCDVPVHSHTNEQFSCVLNGRLRFTLGPTGPGEGGTGAGVTRSVTLGPGEVIHLPPNVPHGAYAEEDTEVLDIFSPPSTTTGIDRG